MTIRSWPAVPARLSASSTSAKSLLYAAYQESLVSLFCIHSFFFFFFFLTVCLSLDLPVEFAIVTPERVWKLQAETVGNCEQWRAAITAVLQEMQSEVTSIAWEDEEGVPSYVDSRRDVMDVLIRHSSELTDGPINRREALAPGCVEATKEKKVISLLGCDQPCCRD